MKASRKNLKWICELERWLKPKKSYLLLQALEIQSMHPALIVLVLANQPPSTAQRRAIPLQAILGVLTTGLCGTGLQPGALRGMATEVQPAVSIIPSTKRQYTSQKQVIRPPNKYSNSTLESRRSLFTQKDIRRSTFQKKKRGVLTHRIIPQKVKRKQTRNPAKREWRIGVKQQLKKPPIENK